LPGFLFSLAVGLRERPKRKLSEYLDAIQEYLATVPALSKDIESQSVEVE